MMKRMNESRTLPQARATMLEASPPRNAAAGTAGRSRGATHATRREALESAPARGSGRPGRDRWGEQPGNRSQAATVAAPRSPLVHEGEQSLCLDPWEHSVCAVGNGCVKRLRLG